MCPLYETINCIALASDIFFSKRQKLQKSSATHISFSMQWLLFLYFFPQPQIPLEYLYCQNLLFFLKSMMRSGPKGLTWIQNTLTTVDSWAPEGFLCIFSEWVIVTAWGAACVLRQECSAWPVGGSAVSYRIIFLGGTVTGMHWDFYTIFSPCHKKLHRRQDSIYHERSRRYIKPANMLFKLLLT